MGERPGGEGDDGLRRHDDGRGRVWGENNLKEVA